MTSRTQHKTFALRIGAFSSSDDYEKFQFRNEAKNAAIRKARNDYFDSIGTSSEKSCADEYDRILATPMDKFVPTEKPLF